jgi:hypothetical protein
LKHAFYSAHRDDKDLVLDAVRQDWRAIEFASARLQGDREVVREALRQSWRTLEFVSEEIQGDREIMLEAVRQDSVALRYASEALRVDPTLVHEAQQRGMSLSSNGDDISYPYPDAWSRAGAQIHSRQAPGGALDPPAADTERGHMATEAKGAMQAEVDAYNEKQAPPAGGPAEAGAEAK